MQKRGSDLWKRVLAYLLICCMAVTGWSGNVLAAQEESPVVESPADQLQQGTEAVQELAPEMEIADLAEAEDTADNTKEALPEEPLEEPVQEAGTEVPDQEGESQLTEEAEVISEAGELPEGSEMEAEISVAEEKPEAAEDTQLEDQEGSAKKAGWMRSSNGKYRYVLSNGQYAKGGWKDIGKYRFYFDSEGYLKTGWLKLSSGTYYLKKTGEAGIQGAMLKGWQDIGGKRFYFKKTGAAMGKMFVGWQNIGNYRYYFKGSGGDGVKGSLWLGWLKQYEKIYYLKQTGADGVMGRMLKGWQNIGGKTFYFKATGTKAGVMFEDFQNVGDYRYYFKEDGTYGQRGAVLTGWQTIDKNVYKFNDSTTKGVKGRALTGWQNIGKYRFYFTPSGTAKGRMLTDWQTIDGKKYFFKRTGDYGIKGAMLKGKQTIDGKEYIFGSDGVFQQEVEKPVSSRRTIKGLLQNAMKPMGSTLYIWGGGHDYWSGGDAVRIGVNPQWKKFFDSQGSDYNYTRYKEKPDGSYYYGYGLDCSGFVGWSVYNTIYDKSGQTNCTTGSGDTGELYYRRGWGSYKEGFSEPSFRAGDVVGYNGHVWIVGGECDDGSYIILHSSPQGVKMAGTVRPDNGSSDSDAVALARKYMRKHFSGFTDKFPNDGLTCGNSYLRDSSSKRLYRFRWSLGSSGVMSDPDGYTGMGAEEILKDLLGS